MMNLSRIPLFFCRTSGALAALCALFACTAMAEEIKIGGTGNALGTMRLLGEAFNKVNPNIKVTVMGSMGSSGAVKAVPKGAIDIGLTSRPLTAEERAAGAVMTEYARSTTVFAVAMKSKVISVTRDQIADIYSGRLSIWPDGTVIRPILRQPGDDNTRQIKTLSPAIDKALSLAEKRPGVAYAFIDQEAADKIETIPGAIGVTTVALIKSERRALRPLTLDGVEPTANAGAAGAYPLIKNFFMITRPAPSADVQKFIAFVNSPAGRDILTQTGHWLP